jgi:outer membrane protein OmpA-like peptidoglycan-associated protein
MISKMKLQLAMSLATGAMLAACAAKPPNVHPLDASADAAHEVELTQQMINQAKDENLDIMAPKNFERAQETLTDARDSLNRGKSNEKILAQVADARAWLAEAQTKGEVTRSAAGDVSDARSGAIRAGAPALYPKEFKKLDEQARDAAADAEKGALDKATKQGNQIMKGYHDLEVQAVTKNFLGEAQANMANAKKLGAEKAAPKTYGLAESKMAYAQSLIQAGPRNRAGIAKASAEATDTSQFLVNVTQKVKQGNTEDLVLQSEKQRALITGLAVGAASTEAELAQKNSVLKTADALRSQLKPSEAEVFVENNAVKVRLKGVQFASNKATLNKKSTALLEKVDKALGAAGVSKITVEGHTDATGSEDKNKEISQKRAESVEKYMASKGNISSDRIEAVGRGSENPISDNKTQKGRAENRRIDLIVEPKVTE